MRSFSVADGRGQPFRAFRAEVERGDERRILRNCRQRRGLTLVHDTYRVAVAEFAE